jgi:hypothetical protein
MILIFGELQVQIFSSANNSSLRVREQVSTEFIISNVLYKFTPFNSQKLLERTINLSHFHVHSSNMREKIYSLTTVISQPI